MNSWYSIQNKGADTAEISIHDTIGMYGVTGSQFMADLDAIGIVDKINLSIHSNGGDVLEGWAIYNRLLSHPAHVTAKIEGLAASMASVIAMAADEIEIPENGWMMIHDATAGAYGNASEIEDMAATLRKIQGGIVKAYAHRTGLPEDEISDLMSHTTYMDGAEAVEKGFATKVLKSFKAAACLKRWRNNLTDELPTGLLFESEEETVMDVRDALGAVIGSVTFPEDREPIIPPKPPENTLPENTLPTPTPQITMSEPAPPAAPLSIKDALAQDKPRREEIAAIGNKFNLPEAEINEAIENGVEIKDFRNAVVDSFNPDSFNVQNVKELDRTGEVGDKEARGYSLFKALNEQLKGGKLSGLENDVQTELAGRYRNATGEVPNGLLIPGEWLNAHDPSIRNAATVGSGTSGGNTVETEMQSLTDYLKDYSILPTVGATIFRDAVGNLEFPRATAGYSGTWDAENDSISNADATFAANLTLSPKRVGAGTALSKQLLAQSSVDFEGWSRGELLYAIATAVDRGAITGSGSSDQPTGLLSASGTGSYTWVTGTSAWKNIIAQWKVLRAAKCPMRSVAWLSDEVTRADWSGTPKVAGASAFVLEQLGAAMQSSVYGFPFYDHTDVTTKKVILGDFSSLMVAQWGGIELVVDPYSQKKAGQVELFAQTFCDVGVRQPAAFVIGNDGTDHAGSIS